MANGSVSVREKRLSEQLHPMAAHHLPFFITPPNQVDVLMVVTGIMLVAIVLWVGTLYWGLHSLPERMAHKSQKLQFEIVAVLGLLALFTHNHVFWVAALLLAMIDLPDFGTPLRSIAGSVEKIAGVTPEGGTAGSETDLTLAAPGKPSKAEGPKAMKAGEHGNA